MKRRDFFNTAVVIGACLPLPGLAAEQDADKAASSSKTKDGSKPERKRNMKDEFKPGDKVPVTGIYDVIHDKVDGDDHAAPHQVTAIAGTTFPPCRVCRDQVRFCLHQAVDNVQDQGNFKK